MNNRTLKLSQMKKYNKTGNGWTWGWHVKCYNQYSLENNAYMFQQGAKIR